jgi:hypothetical protein
LDTISQNEKKNIDLKGFSDFDVAEKYNFISHCFDGKNIISKGSFTLVKFVGETVGNRDM